MVSVGKKWRGGGRSGCLRLDDLPPCENRSAPWVRRAMPPRMLWSEMASDSSDEAGLALWTMPRATRSTSEEEPPARAGAPADAAEPPARAGAAADQGDPPARAGAAAEASSSEDRPARRRTKPVLTPARDVARREDRSPAPSKSPTPPARAGAKGNPSARRGVRFREEAEVREYVPESADSSEYVDASEDESGDDWPAPWSYDAGEPEGWWDASRWRRVRGRWFFRYRGEGPEAGGSDVPRSSNPARTARNARRKAKKLQKKRQREQEERAVPPWRRPKHEEGDTRPRKKRRPRTVDNDDI